MNSLFSILLKNIILFILVVVSLVFIFTQYVGYKEVRFIFSGLGILYVIAACYEALALSKIKPTTKKFIYFPDGFVAKRIIKIIAFICVGVVLYYSGSIIKYMAFLCFLIAFTEIVVTVWRKMKSLCFVALEDNQLLVSTNKFQSATAKEIEKIQSRHGLMYFVNYNKNTITLRTDMMSEKTEFQAALNEWITKNNLSGKVISE